MSSSARRLAARRVAAPYEIRRSAPKTRKSPALCAGLSRKKRVKMKKLSLLLRSLLYPYFIKKSPPECYKYIKSFPGADPGPSGNGERPAFLPVALF